MKEGSKRVNEVQEERIVRAIKSYFIYIVCYFIYSPCHNCGSNKKMVGGMGEKIIVY